MQVTEKKEMKRLKLNLCCAGQ